MHASSDLSFSHRPFLVLRRRGSREQLVTQQRSRSEANRHRRESQEKTTKNKSRASVILLQSLSLSHIARRVRVRRRCPPPVGPLSLLSLSACSRASPGLPFFFFPSLALFSRIHRTLSPPPPPTLLVARCPRLDSRPGPTLARRHRDMRPDPRYYHASTSAPCPSQRQQQQQPSTDTTRADLTSQKNMLQAV